MGGVDIIKDNILRVDTNNLKYSITESFKDEGNTIDIKIVLPYSSLQTVRNIKCCSECPVGYMENNCGRRVPLDYDTLPESCKLKSLYISDLLRTLADSVDIANMME